VKSTRSFASFLAAACAALSAGVPISACEFGDELKCPCSGAVPTALANDGFLSISAGHYHTCGVSPSGQAVCWGANWDGQLGIDSNASHNTPASVQHMNCNVAAVLADHSESCAIRADGSFACWGRAIGVSGPDLDTFRLAVPALSTEINSIALGSEHMCVLTSDASVSCWTWTPSRSDSGSGSISGIVGPKRIDGFPTGVLAIAAGYHHTCALTADDSVMCWGKNHRGQIGDGSNQDRAVPTSVLGIGRVRSIAAGAYHTCAITEYGALACWGANGEGQLGNGSTTDRNEASFVVGLTAGVASTSAGLYHTCAVARDGTVSCWGSNANGQLGSSGPSSFTPKPVASLSNVVQVSAGSMHTCAISQELDRASAWCWGDNSFGALGDGTNTQRSTPTRVSGLE